MKPIELLLELQGIELLPRKTAEQKARAGELRTEIPDPLLGHYDRLMHRGKKGVAEVRNGVCGGCRMRLPSGVHAQLIRDDDITMCDNCARYLVLAAEAEPEPAPRKKRAGTRKPRRKAEEPAIA